MVRADRRAAAATEAGYFTEQILPIEVPVRKGTITFATDEQIQPGATAEDMAKLRPAFASNGTVTPGNASGRLAVREAGAGDRRCPAGPWSTVRQ
jgi:acetyl-CoA C-acetyltransferase